MRYRVWAVMFILATGCGVKAIHIAPRTDVPREYRTTSFNPPPNGEPEPVRYRTAYDAYWWNCVFVRAADLSARCPMMCSGTPAAAAGCADGANDADRDIDDATERHREEDVVRYLRSLTERAGAREKLETYFPDGPAAYRVPD